MDRLEDPGADQEGPEQAEAEGRRRSGSTFQTFSIPRFSWTMIEWRKAVPTSHGISAAFSTGSQPQ